ncbi:MAG: prepilin-type N-terminal cleavage/methylation domain-containing protein [Candidatus Hydrogenedens sp.]|nr:prepilin-type N-terminal cleavage/methylation domain-containing protein [Candidatus Hydrogenedens sp.]
MCVVCKKKRVIAGFTLIEISIVVLIISVLAAITIPALIRSRIHANEASTIWNLRAISTAQVSFYSSHNTYGSFDSLVNGMPTTPITRYLDESWSEGCIRQGYVYSMPEATNVRFVCYASPETLGYSGNRYFRVDHTGIIRYNETQLPSDSDPVIGDPPN